MENGTAYLANLTKMPGVAADMFEWWFAWHGLNDMRYRIWDPEDHYYARQQMPKKVLDPTVPMREKTWGTVHVVLEDIGAGPDLKSFLIGFVPSYAINFTLEAYIPLLLMENAFAHIFLKNKKIPCFICCVYLLSCW